MQGNDILKNHFGFFYWLNELEKGKSGLGWWQWGWKEVDGFDI